MSGAINRACSTVCAKPRSISAAHIARFVAKDVIHVTPMLHQDQEYFVVVA